MLAWWGVLPLPLLLVAASVALTLNAVALACRLAVAGSSGSSGRQRQAVAASLSFAAVAAAGFELVSTRSALALSLDLASRSTRNWGASPFSLWQLVLQLSLCYLPHRQQAASQAGSPVGIFRQQLQSLSMLPAFCWLK